MMAIYIAGEPNSSALALEPVEKMAGIASAINGMCFFAIVAYLSSVT